MHEKNQTDLWLFADFVNFKLTFGLQNQQGVASIPYSLIHIHNNSKVKKCRETKNIYHLHTSILCSLHTNLNKGTAGCLQASWSEQRIVKIQDTLELLHGSHTWAFNSQPQHSVPERYLVNTVFRTEWHDIHASRRLCYYFRCLVGSPTPH